MNEYQTLLFKKLKKKLRKYDLTFLLGFIASNFIIKENDNKEIQQSIYEYIAGVASSLPLKKGLPISKIENIQEILRLANKTFLTCISENIEKIMKKRRLSQDDIYKLQFSHYIKFYNIFVRGEGYPNQLWNEAIELYSPCNNYLKSKLGFTIEEIVEVFQWIKEKIEKNATEHAERFCSIVKEDSEIWNRWIRSEISYEEMLKEVAKIDRKKLREKLEQNRIEIRDIFIIKIDEIKQEFGEKLINAFLKRFATRFGEINKNYCDPADFNELNRTPLLMINSNKVLVPIPPLLWQVPVKTLHYDLIQDPKYRDRYAEIRGKMLENKAYKLFRKVFGAENIYLRCKYKFNGKEFEQDIIIKFDTKLILVECKSKGLTLPSRKGNFQQIKKDFKEAIQKSYDQAKRVLDHVISSQSIIFKCENYKKLVLSKNDFDDIFLVSIISELYGPLSTDLSNVLNKSPSDPYPWVVSIRDLELIVSVLNDPYKFIHFLKRRLKLHGIVFSIDELDYVGNYVKNGLFFEKELKQHNIILLNGFTDIFDRLYCRGELSSLELNANEKFDKLLNDIKKLGKRGHSNIILLLLDLDNDTKNNLIKQIQTTINRTKEDNKSHDFTFIFNDFGITFMTDTSKERLKKRLYSYVILRKYCSRAETWLGLGKYISYPSFMVDEAIYINDKWKYDKKMESHCNMLKNTR